MVCYVSLNYYYFFDCTFSRFTNVKIQKNPKFFNPSNFFCTLENQTRKFFFVNFRKMDFFGFSNLGS